MPIRFKKQQQLVDDLHYIRHWSQYVHALIMQSSLSQIVFWMAKSRIKPADLLLKFLGLPLYPL